MTTAAASYGDLVCGLTAVVPPTPFVGEVGNPADAVAMGLITGILSTAGVPTTGIPTVKVNGNPVGTVTDLATTLPGAVPPRVAQMLLGSPVARIAGQAMTFQLGPAHVTPTSAMVNMGGTQEILRVQGTPPTPEMLELMSDPAAMGEALMAELRTAIPDRTDFGEASTLAEVLAGCSMARHLDMAPGEYEVLVGDPVDVVTGSVVIRSTDYERGVPALRLRRRYDSRRSDRCSSLGYGWCHELEQQVYFEVGRVVLRDGDGREKEFDTSHLSKQVSRPGDVLADATGRYRLVCVAERQWELSDGETTRYFGPVEGEREAERERGVSRLLRVAVPASNTVTECVYERGALVEVLVDGSGVLRFEHADGLLRRVYAVGSGGDLLQARYEYSAERDLLRVFDAHGRAREYDYVDHLLIRDTNREGGSFRYGYDGVGCRARCTRAWGDGGYLSRSLEYDPQGRVTLVHDSYGQATVYRYNPAGLVTRIDTPDGAHRTLRYDRRLRLVHSTWSDGTQETAAYDRSGRVVHQTRRDGSSTELKYAPDGRLAEATDAQGGRWGYTYDERGHLRRVEDPAGHAIRFDYDRRGGMCRVTEATGHQQFIRLNERGQIVEMPRATGGRVAYSYDDDGRLSAARDSEDRLSRWQYDPQGRLQHRDGPTTRTTWERNAEGRVVAVQHGTHRTTIERDAFGLVRQLRLPEQRIRYAVDTEGRLLRAEDAEEGTERLKLERAEDGRVEAWQAPATGRCELRRQALSSRIVGLSLGDRTIDIDWNEAGRIAAVRGSDGRTCRYTYRPDGLLMEAHSERIACTFEREPRGAICRQRWGEVVIEGLHPDHRGRRAGLRMGDLRVSYLRGPGGTVEDVAVLSGTDDGPSLDAASTAKEGSAAVAPEPARYDARDALWRPLSRRGAEHQVWDEGQCVVLDGQPRVHHPDEDRLMFVVSATGSVQAVDADGLDHHRPPPRAPLDEAHAHAFPAPLPENAERALPTPSQLLGEMLGYRAWNPDVRPLPGRAPWDPDAWEPRIDSPAPDVGRLDPTTILRALGSPHPPPKLAI